MEGLLLGVGSALALLFTTTNAIGIKNVAKHAVKVDIGGTIVLFMLFAGTSTLGVFTAMFGGLFIAGFTKSLRTYWNWAARRGHLSPLDEPKDISRLEMVDAQVATTYAKDTMDRIYRNVGARSTH